MEKWSILDHTFKFREGDTDEKGGCTFIGGSWKKLTTKDLFANKKIILFSFFAYHSPLARYNIISQLITLY